MKDQGPKKPLAQSKLNFGKKCKNTHAPTITAVQI